MLPYVAGRRIIGSDGQSAGSGREWRMTTIGSHGLLVGPALVLFFFGAKRLPEMARWLWSIVRLRLREVRPRKSPRSGTGPWHRASKLVKSLPMGSPSQDRDAGSNPAGATTHSELLQVLRFHVR